MFIYCARLIARVIRWKRAVAQRFENVIGNVQKGTVLNVIGYSGDSGRLMDGEEIVFLPTRKIGEYSLRPCNRYECFEVVFRTFSGVKTTIFVSAFEWYTSIVVQGNMTVERLERCAPNGSTPRRNKAALARRLLHAELTPNGGVVTEHLRKLADNPGITWRDSLRLCALWAGNPSLEGAMITGNDLEQVHLVLSDFVARRACGKVLAKALEKK